MKLHLSRVLLLSLLVCCFLFHCTQAGSCQKGQYFHKPRFGPSGCTPCSRGYECPGDDLEHICEDNTYAPSQGMSQCIPCPEHLPIPAPVPTYCMPPDTPKDIIQLPATELNRPYSHFTTELDFDGTIYPHLSDAKLIAIVFSTNNSVPLAIWGSTKTGNANENNYQVKSYGINVTIAFEKPSDASFLPIYMTVEQESAPRIPVITNLLYSLTSMIKISTDGLHLVAPRDLFQEYYFFELNGVERRSNVNITVSGTSSTSEPMEINLFAHRDRSVMYPNLLDNDYFASISGGGSITLIQTNLEPGLMFFSINADMKAYSRIDISISIRST